MGAKPRLIYDGFCNLCTTVVRILNLLDRHARIQYLPNQKLSSKLRTKYALSEEILQGQMHLILGDDSIVSGSTGLAAVVELLTPFHAAALLLRTNQAQQIYTWIATRRYGLFGCRDKCCMPPTLSRSV